MSEIIAPTAIREEKEVIATALAGNPRMSLQVKNLARLDADTRRAIQEQAADLRARGGAPARATAAALFR